MSINLVIILSLLIFFLFLIFGLYIHSTLIAVGIIGVILLGDGAILSGFLGGVPFNQAAVYSLSTIPLFVLMAQFVLNSDIVKILFSIVYNISHGSRKLLGALTLVVGAFLGAVSGSGTATAASLGQVAVPELSKYGYSEELASTISAAAGSLSGIIPPTVILILFGSLTETPISQLFTGAIIPGSIVTLCYILATFYFLNTKKEQNYEAVEFEGINISKKDYIITLSTTFFIAAVIFGGIYSGFTTPTEAGALGALAAFISAILLKKVNAKFLWNCVKETGKVTAMVLFIVIAAKVFSLFVSLSMLPQVLIGLLKPLMDSPNIILFILLAVYFVLFMFLEGTAVIVMTTPILLPIINQLNVNLIWFGVFVGVTATIGLITPPVGISVYAVCGVTKCKLEKVFKSSTIFAIFAAVITGALMIIFPEIALWLPSTM